jgi:putative transposase
VWNWASLICGALRATLRRREALVFENLLLRQQLAVALRARPRPRLRWRDRMFWVLARRLCADWRSHLVLVRPETMLRWHRQSWRGFWWWRSRRPKGRPRLPKQVRDLIHRLSEENRRWGTERIRGELLKLGITVSNGSIRRYWWRPAPRPPSQTRATFLRSHAHAIWAADLFTVQTVAFRTLYVLFFIAHGRRELVHLAVTAHPTAAWVWQQLIEATPWNRKPTYLIRDRDRVYGGDFVPRAEAVGIQTLLTPFRAPSPQGERRRRAGGAQPPERVLGPRARPQRAAPAQRPRRVRGVLQRRPAAPQPGAGAAAPHGAQPGGTR